MISRSEYTIVTLDEVRGDGLKTISYDAQRRPVLMPLSYLGLRRSSLSQAT